MSSLSISSSGGGGVGGGHLSISGAMSPAFPSFPAKIGGGGASYGCHWFWHNAALVLPSALFVVYLAYDSKKDLKKLRRGRSYVMIAYYVLLWFSALINLAWCCFQEWQCAQGKEIAWNLLSLFTSSGMLYLEISLVAFLLQENYASGLETLAHNLIISGLLSGVDMLLKAIFVFGFGLYLFNDVDASQPVKWGFWIVHKLLITAAYGYILYVHYSKWRDKLPLRPAFYKYVIAMFVINSVSFFACGLGAIGAGFGVWLYNLLVICYHSLYLPYLYVTFLANFFQEEDLLLDNAYYSEMKDAGFFYLDWD